MTSTNSTTAVLDATIAAKRSAPLVDRLIEPALAAGLLNAELVHRRDQLRAWTPPDARLPTNLRVQYANRASTRADAIAATRSRIKAGTAELQLAMQAIPDDKAAAEYRAENVRLRAELLRREALLRSYEELTVGLPVMREELARLERTDREQSEREAAELADAEATVSAGHARKAWLENRIRELEAAAPAAAEAVDAARRQVVEQAEALGLNAAEIQQAAATEGTRRLNARLAAERFPEPSV